MCGCVGQRDAQPAYFFFCAGQAAIDRRRASQAAREARGGVPSPIGEVLPGAFVGQLLLSAGNGAPEVRMNEDEFVRHLEVSGLMHASLMYAQSLPEALHVCIIV